MIQGSKIVTCEEMRSIDAQCDTEELMDRAGEALLSVVLHWFELSDTPKNVVLTVGKGNKGGDALTLGKLLLANNVHTSAILTYPMQQLTPLCKSRLDAFIKAGGAVHPLHMEKIVSTSLIVDGIVGTGFRGTPDEQITHAINWVNNQNAPVLAIDIPSGLDGSTGVVETVAIQATLTCCLGLAKLGCFIADGWNYVGSLLTCDIGIPKEILSHVHSDALLLKPESLALPPIIRTRHKYEAGYVLGISGSPSMPGAAALASLAALRAGAGVVRLFTQPDTSPVHFAPEVIREVIDLKRIEEEQERADAIFIGPGLGRTSNFKKLFKILTKPTVVDGDGLFHLPPDFTLPHGSILTPHHGEMTRLLGCPPTLEICKRWADEHSVTVILKGAPTIIFHPNRQPLVVAAGDPGMATAGSGDVLTGIVTALLAQKLPADQAAPLAAYLHGRAGELAAEKLTSYSLIASDLIKYLPKAFAEI